MEINIDLNTLLKEVEEMKNVEEKKDINNEENKTKNKKTRNISLKFDK